MAITINEKIQSQIILHQTQVINYANKLSKDISAGINVTNPELADYLKTRLPKITTNINSREFQKQMIFVYKDIKKIRAENTLSIQKKIIDRNIKYYEGMKGQELYFKAEMLDFANKEVEYVDKLIHTEVPLDFNSKKVPKPTIVNTVALGDYSGKTIKQWFKKLADDDAATILQTVRNGMSSSNTPNQIISEVFKTDIPKTMRSAEALGRTMTNGVGNASRSSFYETNSDIISGIQFVATLDLRTTQICGSLDGQVFPNIQECPQPPLHVQCRSTTAPVLDGVKVFGQRQAIADGNFRTEARNLFLERETNRGTSLTDAKAMWHDKSLSQVTHYRLDAQKKFNSAMGKVPMKTNYSQWLKGLSEREQVIALGKTKAKLFRSGDYKLTDFVSKYNKNLTLDQIYKK